MTASDWDGTVSVLLGNGSGGFSAPVTYAVGSYPAVGRRRRLQRRRQGRPGGGEPRLEQRLDPARQRQRRLRRARRLRRRAQPALGRRRRLQPRRQGRPGGGERLEREHVAVLLGNGSGGFATHVDYAVGTDPTSVAVVDLNADGKADLAVANNGSSERLHPARQRQRRLRRARRLRRRLRAVVGRRRRLQRRRQGRLGDLVRHRLDPARRRQRQLHGASRLCRELSTGARSPSPTSTWTARQTSRRRTAT